MLIPSCWWCWVLLCCSATVWFFCTDAEVIWCSVSALAAEVCSAVCWWTLIASTTSGIDSSAGGNEAAALLLFICCKRYWSDWCLRTFRCSEWRCCLRVFLLRLRSFYRWRRKKALIYWWSCRCCCCCRSYCSCGWSCVVLQTKTVVARSSFRITRCTNKLTSSAAPAWTFRALFINTIIYVFPT